MTKQPAFKLVFWILASVLLMLLGSGLVSAQPSPDDGFITITPDNADQIELGYVFPGICSDYQRSGNLVVIAKDGIYDLFTGEKRVSNKGFRGNFSPDERYFWYSEGTIVDTQSGDQFSAGFGSFSDDSKYAAALDGVYEVATQKKLFTTPDVSWFSHDGRYVAISGDAMYEVKTGKKRYRLPPGIVSFSPDSQYFAVWDYGVYETATGKQIIVTLGTNPTFSPNSQYVAFSSDGVYDLKTQTKIISTASEDNKTFSPDSSLIAIANDGVYELPSTKLRFKIAGDKFIPPQFIKDTSYLVISGDAVYNLKTNQQLYQILRPTTISKNGDFIIISLEGIIETATGKVKLLTGANYMAGDNKILFWNLQTEVGTRCLIFGVKGDKWPYRMGMVEISGNTLFYDEPNGKTVKTDAQGKRLFILAQQIVYAQTADKQWLRLRNHYWVKTSDIRPLWLPDDLPIDNPS